MVTFSQRLIVCTHLQFDLECIEGMSDEYERSAGCSTYTVR